MQRGVIWQQAKGMLLSILHLYYHEPEEYEKARMVFEGFIEQVESELDFV